MCVFILRYILSQYPCTVHNITFSDAEMNCPYDPKGCFQPGGAKQFSVCGLCGHDKIDWTRKKQIESSNKVNADKYKTEVLAYNEVVKTKKKSDTSLKKPVLEQKPLLIRCCCNKFAFAWLGGNCPTNCGGTCEICVCSCSFVCSVTDYNQVVMTVMERKRASTLSDDSAERIDHARQFLRGGDKIR